MQGLATDAVRKQFERQVAQRDKQRQKRAEREDTYQGKVEEIEKERFEKIKMEAILTINTDSVNLKPGAIINALYKKEESKVVD